MSESLLASYRYSDGIGSYLRIPAVAFVHDLYRRIIARFQRCHEDFFERLKLNRITEKDRRDSIYHPVFEETRKTFI